MRFYILISVILLLGCQMKEESKNLNDYPFYVGTYTEKESDGIYKYILNVGGTLKQIGLVARSENPSFLALSRDKKFLIAVNETNHLQGQGSVESYLVADDSLRFLSRSPSGGAHPCFVAVNNKNFIVAANYTGGTVGLLKLNEKGLLSSVLDIQQHVGSGSTKRQLAPHAHSAWFSPNSNDLISVDLGTNELWFSQLDCDNQKLISKPDNKLKMKPGAGPRHLAFHTDGKWIYVLNELNATITLVQKNSTGNYESGHSVSTLPSDFHEPNTCAHIITTRDGKFVYASNRGHNSIAIFAVDSEDGTLSIIGHESTRGDGPRNFVLSPDEMYLLVANQHTDNIVSFKRDPVSGELTMMAETKAPTPVCILFE